jgi:hypothetical protein
VKDKKIVARITDESQEMIEAKDDAAEIMEAMSALGNAAEAGDTEAKQMFRDLTERIEKAGAAVKTDAQRKRELGVSNRAAMATALNALLRLNEVSDSKTHMKEVTFGLFQIIEEAQNRLMKLTGAPGIILQSELEQCCNERDAYGNDPRVVFPAALGKLNEKFEAGWLVQPGRFGMKRDHMGVVCIGDFSKTRAPRPRRAPKIDTPTPAQLQAWFDLPSEPRS